MDLEQAYRTVVANQISSNDLSHVALSGELEASLLLFENILMLLFLSSRYEGIVVTYDRSEQFPVLEVVRTGEEVFGQNDGTTD